MQEGIIRRPTWVRVRKGVFERDALPGDPVELVIREEYNGKIYSKVQFNYIIGCIKGMQLHERVIKGNTVEFLQITMEDPEDNDSRILQMNFDSPAARGVLTRFENIDLLMPVCIMVGYDPIRSSSFTWMTQNGEKVFAKYKKDTPHDMPQPIKKTINNKEVFDWGAQLQWWRQKVREYHHLVTKDEISGVIGVSTWSTI